VRSLLVGIAILALGALIIGGLVISSDGIVVEGTEQVSSPEASANDATDSQVALIAAIAVGLIGGTVVVGGGIAGLFYLLSAGVERAEQTEPSPVNFSLSPGDESSIGAAAARNAPLVIGGLSVAVVATFFLLALLSGAL
jgi:hypothetical protein